jgi:hypothetical protein
MANAFSGQTLADVAKVVRDIQSGKRALNEGIARQLKEQCWTLTDGKDMAGYMKSLQDPEQRATAASDWLAVSAFGQAGRKP